MAAPQGKIALVQDEASKRIAAEKSEFNKSVREMRKLGILPPGVKPKAKHFNMLAAYQNSNAAKMRATSVARDLAAFESVGGMGAQVLATLNNPKAKATERAIALQAMIQITKSAPLVVSAARISKVLRRTPSGVAGYMRELVASGAVSIIGYAERTKAPTFVLAEGQSIPVEADIFDECRANWRGYHIHKIFGSAGRMSA